MPVLLSRPSVFNTPKGNLTLVEYSLCTHFHPAPGEHSFGHGPFHGFSESVKDDSDILLEFLIFIWKDGLLELPILPFSHNYLLTLISIIPHSSGIIGI